MDKSDSWRKVVKMISEAGIRRNMSCTPPKEQPSKMVIDTVCSVDPSFGKDHTAIAWICMKCGTVNSEALCNKCGNSK